MVPNPVPSRLRDLLVAIAVFGALAGVSGCGLKEWVHNEFMVGPNYGRPVAAVADQWIDANDSRVSSQMGDYSYWWRTLNDPVLDSLVQTASNQNLTLRAAGFRIMESQARRQIALGFLFPQTQQFTADYQRVNLSGENANVAPVRHFSDWDTGFNLAWELDLWGRFRRAVEEQDALLDASIEDYDDVLVSLQGEVALTYVQIRTFEQRIAYARENAASQKKIYDLTLARLREGDISELDVKQAENIWRTTEGAVPQLEAGRRQLIHSLAVLMGIPPRDLTDLLGQRTIPDAPSDIIVGIPAALLSRRPDVRRAERLVAAQSARIGIATSDLYPAVSILGSLGWNAEDAADLFNSDAFRGNIGPSIRWNILNYGRIENNILAEDARFQSLIAEYEQTVLRANAEVEDGIVGFLQAQAELEQFVAAEAAARRALELATTQYSEGAADFSRVLLASNFLTDSQDQLAVSQANVSTNLIRVYRALGGGWMTRFAVDSVVVPLPVAGAGPGNRIPPPAPGAAMELPPEPGNDARPVPPGDRAPRVNQAAPADKEETSLWPPFMDTVGVFDAPPLFHSTSGEAVSIRDLHGRSGVR